MGRLLSTAYRALAILISLGAMFPLLAKAQAAPQSLEATEFTRAEQAQKSGNYRTAEAIYKKLLSKNPDLWSAQFNLGLTYYLDRKYKESSDCLLKVLKTKPELYPALLIAGIDFLKLDVPARAVPLLRKARKQRPNDEYANHNLASAEYLAGDYVQACANYIDYLRQPGKSKDIQSWYGLGEVAMMLGRNASAQLGNLPASEPYRLRFLAEAYRGQDELGLMIAKLMALEPQPHWSEWAKVQLGDAYLEQHNAAQAAAEFHQVLQENPHSARAHLGLGISFLMKGNVKSAIEELKTAAQGNPWVFAQPASLPGKDDAKVQAAIAKVQSAGATGSPLVDAFMAVITHTNAHDADTAFASFDKVLKSACDARRRKNESKFEVVLRSHPSPQRLLNLAQTFLDEGDAESALHILNRMPHTEGEERDRHAILLGRALATEGDPLRASSALLTVIRHNNTPQSLYWVATSMEQIAELALNRVLMLNPNSEWGHLLQAQIEIAHSRTNEAIHEFELAVQSAPQDPTTHFKLGDQLWQAGRFQEAIATLQQGLKLDSHNAAAYFEIGDSYLSMGNPKQAMHYLQEALEHNPHLIAANKDRAKIYYNQGDYRQTVNILGKIATHDSGGSIHYLMFRAYTRLGDRARAAAALRRFQQLKALSQKKALFNAGVAESEARVNKHGEHSQTGDGSHSATH